MSSRFTSPFDDLLERNRRELDALYRDAGPSRTSRTPATPTASEPARQRLAVMPYFSSKASTTGPRSVVCADV